MKLKLLINQLWGITVFIFKLIVLHPRNMSKGQISVPLEHILKLAPFGYGSRFFPRMDGLMLGMNSFLWTCQCLSRVLWPILGEPAVLPLFLPDVSPFVPGLLAALPWNLAPQPRFRRRMAMWPLRACCSAFAGSWSLRASSVSQARLFEEGPMAAEFYPHLPGEGLDFIRVASSSSFSF